VIGRWSETMRQRDAITITNSATPTPTITNTPTPSATATPTFTPSLTATATLVLTPPSSSGPVTINYTYDPLNRLTAADYSTGDYYHYTYDPVGNRLSLNNSVNNQQTTTNYTYDIANRMTQAGNATYTWDNNGNLLSNGTNTYTYDPANRLATVSRQQASISYGYNGLGDRLQQTINSQTTNYALDINTNLPDVLTDSNNIYTYGLGDLAQFGTTNTDYFLGDALGSTRQLSDTSGAITLSQSYDPFGNGVGSTGNGSSIFGYTGEQTDTTGLQFLRARYYDPGTGRFQSRDPFPGYLRLPQSQNPYAYGLNNPVFYIDPSGRVVFPWNNHNPSDAGQLGLGNNFANGWVDKALDAVHNMISGNCINWGKLLMDAGAQAIAEIIKQNEAFNAWIINSYMQGWTNFKSAVAVLNNPNAPALYKIYSALYAGIWIAAHAGLAIGTAVLLWQGAAALGQAAYPIILKACLLSAVCATIIGAGVMGVQVIKNSVQIGQEGVNRVLDILNDPTAETEQSVWVLNNGELVPYPFARFDIVTSDAIHEVKNVTDLSLSQDFMEQAYRYKMIADSGGLDLHYWLLNDKPGAVVDWLQQQGIIVH
jgi:RHS repeat-associated protein